MPVPISKESRHCENCGIEIEPLVPFTDKCGNKITVLETETLYILKVEAICKHCGAPFYHSVSIGQLQKLIRSAGREATQDQLAK